MTTLRSNGHDVHRATDVFGAETDDERLLRYCGENGYLLVTHDEKDFADGLAESVEHAGVVPYTDANYLRDDPDGAVRTFERVLAHHPHDELRNELVWLAQWRR